VIGHYDNDQTTITTTVNNLFDSMIAVAFQITIRAEMYANDVFLFLKNYF
jgi:hypothetical protein